MRIGGASGYFYVEDREMRVARATAGEDAHPQSKSFFDKVREMFGTDDSEQEEDVA